MSTAYEPERIEHDIPAPLEVVPAEQVAALADLTAAADAIETVDESTVELANDVAGRIHQLSKDIEARRKELKRPVTDLGKAIDSAAKRALEPLNTAKKTLLGRLGAYQRRIEEERRRAEEEARRKAEEEARLRHEKEVRRRFAEQERARKEAEEMEALLGTPVQAEDPPPAPAPAAEVPRAMVKPVPAKPAAAVTMRTIVEVDITDERAIAGMYEAGGHRLVKVDMAAVKRALQAGCVVPGARLVEHQVAAAKGVRREASG